MNSITKLHVVQEYSNSNRTKRLLLYIVILAYYSMYQPWTQHLTSNAKFQLTMQCSCHLTKRPHYKLGDIDSLFQNPVAVREKPRNHKVLI